MCSFMAKQQSPKTMDVLFYDHDIVDFASVSLIDYLFENRNNGKIQKIKILFNNVNLGKPKKETKTSNMPPCLNSLSDIRPSKSNPGFYHTVVAIKSIIEAEGEPTKTLFWTLEKNNEVIAVQRSSNLQLLISKIFDKNRSITLTYNPEIEKKIVQRFRPNDIQFTVELFDILSFISQHENKVCYKLSPDFNCQGFSKRIIKYIFEEDVRDNCSLIKTLRKTNQCSVGEMKKYIDLIYLDIFNKFDGKKISLILKQIQTSIQHRMCSIDELLLSLITVYRQGESVNIIYHDHDANHYVTCDLDSYLDGGPDVGEIKEVQIFYNHKHPNNSEQEMKELCNKQNETFAIIDSLSKIPSTECPKFICNNTVIIIETIITNESKQSETLFWSMEKNNKDIIIQRSKDIKVLLTKILESDRPNELKYDKDVEKHYTENINVDNVDKVKMIDLLDFIWKHESEHYQILPHFLRCQNFTKRMINYIYKQDMGILLNLLLKVSKLVNFVWEKALYHFVHIVQCINNGLGIGTLNKNLERCTTVKELIVLLNNDYNA